MENRRKIEPKEIPNRLIPRLLVAFTRQLEILVTTLDMVALKLPEREFKGLLNLVRERMLKHVYGINLLCTALKKSALIQSSKNTITPCTSKLKSISKYQFMKILYFTLKQVKDNSQRCAIHDSRIRS